MNYSEEEKKAIEIVKQFNEENRYRDCGRINNAIDTVIRLAEKLEQEKEKNKSISIQYEKIVDKLEEQEEINIQDIVEPFKVESYVCDKTDIKINRETIKKLVQAVKYLDNKLKEK